MNRYVVFLVLSFAAAGFCLCPLEQDQVICDDAFRPADGAWQMSFRPEPGKRFAGFYVDVKGLDEFSVLVNGECVSSVSPLAASGRRTGLVDLSDYTGTLKPGRNTLEIRPGAAGAAQSAEVRAWLSGRAWYLSSFHAHSTYSDGQLSVHDLLQSALANGARFYAITDHDNLWQCVDTAFHEVDGLWPIRGEEWTTDSGHANVLGLVGQDAIEHGSIWQMIDDATYRGGLVQINHPTDAIVQEWTHYPILDPGVDMIEIFNSLTIFPPADGESVSPYSDRRSVAWWQDLLAAGATIAGIGNSDYHGTYPGEHPMKSCSRVFSPAQEVDSVLKYAKLGNVMVCGAPDDSRLYIYADTNANNSWDLVMGDNFRVKAGTRTLRYRVDVNNAGIGDVVRVLDKTGVVYSHVILLGGDYYYDWETTYAPADTDFVRAELLIAGLDYETCTNPIYINHQDYELGPTDVATTAQAWPETLYVGREETLRIRVSNAGGYSPYQFGTFVACDTALFDITGWQAHGEGIGRARHRDDVEGYEDVEWIGGNPWWDRLSAGAGFDRWFTVRPRQEGNHPVLLRGWAGDRLGLVDPTPDTGLLGPESKYWLCRMVTVVDAAGVEEQAEPVRRTSFAVAPNPARNRVVFSLSNAGSDPARRAVLFDVTGREVSALELSALGPGEHKLAWHLRDHDGKDPAPGVYFLRVETSERCLSGRLVVAR